MLRRMSTVSSAQAPAPPDSPELLTIARRVDADGVTLTLQGEIDLASAPALELQMRDAEELKPRRIVLDLAALDFIDSTGVHLLLDAQQRADSIGYELLVAHTPAATRRLFRLAGVDARLRIE
jgi:anti-sigma B factor antagonist